MIPEILTLDELNVIGMGSTFVSILAPESNSQQVIPALWDQFVQRSDELPAIDGPVQLGVCMTPPDGTEAANNDTFYYLACVEANDDESVPEGMSRHRVPAGRYAKFTHIGPITQLGESMQQIHRSWLRDANLKASESRPVIEWYDARFNPTGTDSELDIYIPID
jgi:predicted transcriptional regulator YdeE